MRPGERWLIRPGAEADIPAIVAMIRADDIAFSGGSDVSVESLRNQLSTLPGFELELDLACVERAGKVVGSALVGAFGAGVVVDLAHLGCGIGSALNEWVNERERQRGSDRFRRVTEHGNAAAARLLRADGFELVRFIAQLRREFEITGIPPPPAAPSGYAVRPLKCDDDARLLHEMNARAFGDRIDYVPETFDQFTRAHLHGPEYEPRFSFIAQTDAGAPAGFVIGYRRSQRSAGHIALLAVDAPYRRAGVGRTLLLSALASIGRDGLSLAEVHVASDNPRALDLYTAAAMHEVSRQDHYERPASAGSKSDRRAPRA
jgi:ribosomal protein S18 acetylase RimI-like enzyme